MDLRSGRAPRGYVHATLRLTVASAAALVLLTSAAPHPWNLPPGTHLVDLVAFGVAAAVMNCWTLHMPGYGVIAVVDALYLAAMSILGPGWALMVGVLANLPLTKRNGAPVAWRVTQVTCTLALSGLVYGATAPLLPIPFAICLTAIVLGVAQVSVAATWRACEEDVPFYPAMIHRRQIVAYVAILSPLGILLSALWRIAPLGVLLLLLPIAMMVFSLKRYTELLGEARATIEDPALAVEKRDPNMVGHADRVSRLSCMLARELRLAEDEVEALATAGRLHDLGKIAVPDRILLKADGLDETEFEEVKAHASTGSKVVERCSLVQRQGDVASLIRQHHERYDGRGYPDGLRGEQIRLGARILAVAEAWDTMITPRTWRTVLTQKQAIDRILAGRGTQFDPRVVNALLTILRRQEARIAS